MKFSAALLVLAAGSAAAFAPAPMARAHSSMGALLSGETGMSQLDPAVIARYNDLPFPADTILAEYVWVDAVGNTRSKTRTLPSKKVRSFFLSSW